MLAHLGFHDAVKPEAMLIHMMTTVNLLMAGKIAIYRADFVS